MKKIGKYIVDARIGVGGMGAIYKAFDPYFERVVAIKVMSPQLAADEEFRSRFFREARSTAKLSHPNIVSVYDLGEEDGIPYLVMEYLKGRDLKSIIVSTTRLSLEAQVAIIADVCRGLAHAHCNGIIHRDIKPGNIFLTDTSAVKLLDFGLARGVSSVTLTTKGSILGTPSYMSPEQWANSRVDLRSDIFATGAVFYEFLARRKAFAGDTYEQIFYNIFHCDAEPLQSINPALPDELCRIVHRALARDVSARYQSMPEMLDNLISFSDHLESARAVLTDELSAIVEDSRQFADQNKEFIPESSPADSLPDGTADDYLQILDRVRQAKDERERIGILVAKRKEAEPLLQNAACLEAEGNLEQALLVIDGILADDPDHPRASVMRTRIEQLRASRARILQAGLLAKDAADLLAADDPNACLGLVARALDLDPENEEALRLRGEAEDRIQELLRSEAARQRTLGFSLLAQGDFRQGAAALRAAREVFPDDFEIGEALERAEIQVRADDQRLWAESQLAQARVCQEGEDIAAAREIAARVLEAEPEHSQARELLAEIDRAQQAKQRLDRIAALIARSREMMARKDFETAKICTDEALQLDPEDHELQMLQGLIEEARQSHLRMRKIRMRVFVALAAALLISASAVLIYVGRATGRRSADEDPKPDERSLPSAELASPAPIEPKKDDNANPGNPAGSAPLAAKGSGAAPGGPADAMATLSLVTIPAVSGASVKINDADAGITDATGTITVPVKAGVPQVIEIGKEGHQRFLKSVPAFQSGERRSLSIELPAMSPPPALALLNISSDPTDAAVYVDGARQGSTPLQAKLEPGRHRIEVRKPGYRLRERSSEWSAAEYHLEFALERESGNLQFSVEPAGIIATIGRQTYDTALQKVIPLAPGNYAVQLSKEGYISRGIQIVVSDGETALLAATLDKVPPPAEEFGDSFLNMVNWSAPAEWRVDRQALLARGAGICLLKERTFGNFVLKFSLRLTNGVAASWILRAKDPANYYRIEIRGDAYPDARLRNTTSFYLCTDGKDSEIQSIPVPVEGRKLREWFQTIVEVRENRFRVDVSGKLLSGTRQERWTVADFKAPRNVYPAGQIGFRVSGSEMFDVSGLLVVPSK